MSLSWFYASAEQIIMLLPGKRSIGIRKIEKAWFLEWKNSTTENRRWLFGPIPKGMYSPSGRPLLTFRPRAPRF